MTCPAAQLADPAVTAWVRRRGLCVDADSVEDLDAAIGAGITPAHVVVHGSETSAAVLRRGSHLGAGRFVLGSAGQSAVLAAVARRRTPVIVDVTDGDEALQHAIRASSRLEVFGVRTRVGVTADLGRLTLTMMAAMADVRRRHGALLSRIDFAEVDLGRTTARQLAVNALTIEDAIDEGCARHRLPRPAVIVSPPARQRVSTTVVAAA